MKLNEKTMQSLAIVVSFGIIANLLWGSAVPMIKTGYKILQIASDDTASQLLFAGIRFFTAGILTVILGSILNGGLLIPSKAALPKIGLLSIFQTIIQYVLFYIGCANAAGYKVSIFCATSSFVSILMASLVFRLEKLSAKKILGCILGFSGVILINVSSAGGFDLDMKFVGEGFILISSVSFSFANILTKRYSKTENPVMLCGWQFILGGAVMIGVGLMLGGRLVYPGLTGIGLILYLAMVSAVAFSLNSTLIKYNPVSRVSVFNFLNPIFGVILSIFMLKESTQAFGLKGIVALLLVCLGVFTVNYSKEKKA
jgi:drug/metabolite transporter (DMT)-like permease